MLSTKQLKYKQMKELNLHPRKNHNVKWHPTKNIYISPHEVSAGSNKKVWWRCDRGHEWEAYVKNVALCGSGCPFCSGLRAVRGKSDLATVNPELAVEWDYSKNSYTPDAILPGSNKKAWWKCKKCGRSWEANIASRNRGVGCTCGTKQKFVSSLRKNKIKVVGSLAKKNPELAKEWHPDKNGDLTPYDITTGASTQKVWWKCGKCGRDWQTDIASRHSGLGCSCTTKQRFASTFRKNRIKAVGSLTDNNPKLAREWHPNKNGSLKPSDVTSGSSYKAWWLCLICQFEWDNMVVNRSAGSKCPNCIKRGIFSLAVMNPSLVNEWHPTKNGLLAPSRIYYLSHRKVWWQCLMCNHEWFASVKSRYDGSRCPKCKKIIEGKSKE